MWNLRYYDIIMEIVNKSLVKYYKMLLEFRWRNRMSYTQVCDYVNRIVLRSKNTKINGTELTELIQEARQPLFYTVTETTVSVSMVQIFVSLRAYLRNVRQQDNGVQSHYFVSSPVEDASLAFVEGRIPSDKFGEWEEKNYYLDVLTHPKYVEANNITLPENLTVTG